MIQPIFPQNFPQIAPQAADLAGLVDFDELRCDACGGTDIGHFSETAAEGTERERNRCRECGHESEYIPTLSDIAAACEALRHEHYTEMRLMDWTDDEPTPAEEIPAEKVSKQALVPRPNFLKRSKAQCSRQ